MARRTSLFVAAAVLTGIAGCSTSNPVSTTRHISWAQQEQQQMTTAPISQEEAAPTTTLAQPGYPGGYPALGAGMPVPTTPLVAGAAAIPPLGALAGGLPGPVPPTALSSLEAFPTLAFAPFRYIDLYTPLFSTSFRVAAATLGLPSGLPLSIFSRLHFFGMNSYFGFYAPLFWWHGALQPLAIYDAMNSNFDYPYIYAGPSGLAPFYYSSPSLLAPYAAPVGACGVCGPGSALGIAP